MNERGFDIIGCISLAVSLTFYYLSRLILTKVVVAHNLWVTSYLLDKLFEIEIVSVSQHTRND